VKTSVEPSLGFINLHLDLFAFLKRGFPFLAEAANVQDHSVAPIRSHLTHHKARSLTHDEARVKRLAA